MYLNFTNCMHPLYNYNKGYLNQGTLTYIQNIIVIDNKGDICAVASEGTLKSEVSLSEGNHTLTLTEEVAIFSNIQAGEEYYLIYEIALGGKPLQRPFKMKATRSVRSGDTTAEFHAIKSLI